MDFDDWLKALAADGGSDLYLATGAPPCAKFSGNLRPVDSQMLAPGQIAEIADRLMDDQQKAEFAENLEMNLAISLAGVGRFRVNIFKQRNEVSIVARYIVGSGKSTTLASLIDYRNSSESGHIVTIEDPVEFIHKHKKSIINQRELGVDTRSWGNALKNTLRQAPDVIFIGEIRDRATMEYAISFAETGHLCISTLHANNANQAMERIVNFFPEERRPQLLLDLSLNLIGILSQRLIPTPAGGRCAAMEILLASPLVKEHILNGEIHGLKEVMAKSLDQGMVTFDEALFRLYREGKISEDEALRNADSVNNLRLKIKLADEGGLEGSGGGLQLEDQ